MSELILISSIMLMIVGVIVSAFVGVFIIVRNENIRKNMCTRRVDANIKEFNKSKTKKGWIYSPLYEYQFDGVTYTAYSRSKKYDSDERLGEKERIYVNPHKPNQIYENDEVGTNPVLIIIFSIVVVLFSVSTFGIWSSAIG